MSSANASTPTYCSSIMAPNYLCSNAIMSCLINKLKRMGDVLAPCLTPFSFCIGCYGSLLIMYVDLSFSYICHSNYTISLGTSSPISYEKMSTCLAESNAFLRSIKITTYVSFVFSIFLILIVSYLSVLLLTYLE